MRLFIFFIFASIIAPNGLMASINPNFTKSLQTNALSASTEIPLKIIDQGNQSESDKPDTTLIVAKYADDMYFVMEATGTSPWGQLAEEENKAHIWGQFVEKTGSKALSGVNAFKDRVGRASHVVYVSSVPVTKEWLKKRTVEDMKKTIEMVMTVTTRTYIPFSFNMGITRLPSYAINGGTRHPRISHLLHAFSAKCMQMLFPGEKHYMISWPTRGMLKILRLALRPGEYFIGDSLMEEKHDIEIKKIKKETNEFKRNEPKAINHIENLKGYTSSIALSGADKEKVDKFLQDKADEIYEEHQKIVKNLTSTNDRRINELNELNEYLYRFRPPVQKVLVGYKPANKEEYGIGMFQGIYEYRVLPLQDSYFEETPEDGGPRYKIRFVNDDSGKPLVGKWRKKTPEDGKPKPRFYTKPRWLVEAYENEDQALTAVSEFLKKNLNVGTLISVPLDVLASKFVYPAKKAN